MFNEQSRITVTGSSIRSTRTPTGQRSPAVKSAHKEQGFAYGGGSGFPGSSGTTNLIAGVSGPMANQNLLDGLVPVQEDLLRRYYRDIYYHDAVGGSAADMISTFPYSEFSLTGCTPERIEKYQESMVRLNIRTLMPEATLGYLVEGAYCASLIFNQKDKVFIDLISYPIDDCEIDHLPFYSTDPVITVRTNEQLRKFLNSDHKQVKALKSILPRKLLEVMNSSHFELDPLTCLYIQRKTLPGAEPTSWLKRMLPTYLIEKTLYRGTLVEAMRRQRSMLHIQMGDDTHEFTPEEMAETVNQFQMADLDPLGAIVGTRNNVQAAEIRQGGDFWKWTDNIDVLTPIKLRALGISEAFLSGDSTYSNVETGMSVFMENMDALRSFMTYEVLTNKVFPIVAVSNDFFKDGKKVSTEDRVKMQYQVSNHNDLDIPTVRWHKRLEAKSEENMMELLDTLSQKGFPVPLRMWAAAAKVDLNQLYQDLEQDKLIKEKLAKITGKPFKEPMQGGDEFASLRGMTQQLSRMPILARSFGDGNEVKGETKTGKAKFILNQRKAQAEMNAIIAQATKALNDPRTMRASLARVKQRLARVPRIF